MVGQCYLENMSGFGGAEQIILTNGVPVSRIIPKIDNRSNSTSVDLGVTDQGGSLDGSIPVFVPFYNHSLYPSVRLEIERDGQVITVRKYF